MRRKAGVIWATVGTVVVLVLAAGLWVLSWQGDELPPPDLVDWAYGPHESNIFDLWKTEGEGPHPLVLYIHGGGFKGGDKREMDPLVLKGYLDRGVSVAALNYRLSGAAPFPAPMHDCARALQFIRLHAVKCGVDPTRIAATGGSAGGGIALWLAFHEDLADPESEDPLRRQSTRLSCAAVSAAQSTYDPREIQKMFNTRHLDPGLFPFYGMSSIEDLEDPTFQKLFEEASPITHATADDPPVMLSYPQANKPVKPNTRARAHIHHPRFGFRLKKKLEALGVLCEVRTTNDYPPDAVGWRMPADGVRFVLEHLTGEKY